MTRGLPCQTHFARMVMVSLKQLHKLLKCKMTGSISTASLQ